MAYDEHGLVDADPAAGVTDCCVMGEEGYGFLLLGDLKFFCPGLRGWFNRRDGSPGSLALRCCIWSARSCCRTKLQRDITCVVLRHRQQNVALSDDVVGDRADG